jgi:hypothetical protein
VSFRFKTFQVNILNSYGAFLSGFPSRSPLVPAKQFKHRNGVSDNAQYGI